MAKRNILKKLTDHVSYKYHCKKIHTPLEDAVHQITQRRTDTGLLNEVQLFLKEDIPRHFICDNPVFYLSRYLATPDYETLLFINQIKSYEYRIVIGEDTADTLTSHSALKRNLLKLPIVTGYSKNGRPIIKYHRVGDINTQQGKQLQDVELFDGQNLVDYHHALCDRMFPENVKWVEESAWVNRHSRGQLVKLYESMLALLVTHGIMLEYYEPKETSFMQEVVLPAFNTTKKRFGYSPLIVPLEQSSLLHLPDPNSYPSAILNRNKV